MLSLHELGVTHSVVYLSAFPFAETAGLPDVVCILDRHSRHSAL